MGWGGGSGGVTKKQYIYTALSLPRNYPLVLLFKVICYNFLK